MLRITDLLRISLAATLIACLPAEALGQPARVEVRRLETELYDIGDHEVTGIRWKFDLRIINLSEAPIDLPNPGTGADEGTARTAVDKVQYKQPNGTWGILTATTIAWTTDTKLAPCVSVSPGATLELKNVHDGLLLPRKRLAELGDQPTMRLNLWIGCSKSDSKGAGMFVMTEPFTFRLPAIPPAQEKAGR